MTTTFFKVWSASGLKKAVVATDLQNLIEQGCAKLGLTPENIKLYMDDGTEIDDDLLLKHLPAGTVIYLLTDTDQKPWMPLLPSCPYWQTDSFSPTPSDVSADSCSILNTSVRDDNDLKLRKLPWPKNIDIPEEKFSSHLKEGLETGTLSWDQKHELMNHLGSLIVQYTDFPTLQQRDQVAKVLVDKFPRMKSTIGEGYQGLSTKIHDKMREMRRKKRCNDKSATKMSTPSPKRPKHKNIHTRGVINWSPPPPEGEDDLSMSNHKEWLKKEWCKSIQDSTMVTEKMELCFSYRRKEINSNNSLGSLKEEYPFMFTAEGILKEFQMLMQIDIDKIFLTETNNIAQHVIDAVNSRKGNSKELNCILEEYKSIPNITKRVTDSLVMCILSLPFIFSEIGSLVYKIYPDETSVDEITGAAVTPHVAVLGSPFSSCKVFVVAEGETLIECSEFMQAVIACVALYYCCNIQYPIEAKCTYIFMQMQILKLHYYGKVPRKVITFVDKLKKSDECITEKSISILS